MTPARPRIALAIMCKTPAPGRSKTRLVPPLTPDEAAGLSACFIQDIGARIASLAPRLAPHAAYAPAGSEAALRPLLPPAITLFPQAEGDLGARMQAAIAGLLGAGFHGAILIGADSPTLPPPILRAAIAALEAGENALVLSPALDGGYGLIGLHHAHARLFAEIAWSTAAVLRTTLARAREIALPVTLLDPWYDVDDAAGLARLEAELAGTRPPFAHPDQPLEDAPATRRFLARRRMAALP